MPSLLLCWGQVRIARLCTRLDSVSNDVSRRRCIGCTESPCGSVAERNYTDQLQYEGAVPVFGWRSPPVAEHGADERQHGDGCRIGTQNARAERDADNIRQSHKHRALMLGKTAFGPYQSGDRPRIGAAMRHEGRNWVRHLRVLV